MTFFSKYFTYEELTVTQVPGLQTKNRLAGLSCMPSLRSVANTLLLPVREGLGLPIIVDSGFRCKEVNAAVGGSQTSQHSFGEAADFNVQGFEDRAGQLKVMKWIVDANIPFGQLLLERGCVHISLPRTWAPREVAEYVVATKTKKPLDLSGVSLVGFPK